MNRNKDKIGWCDWTNNPIWGCKNGCWYCYARPFAERRGEKFDEPKFYPERMKQWRRAKAGDRIFLGSMADMFGDWVPSAWLEAVLAKVSEHPELIFQFLTKNPRRYADFAFSRNCWLGVTVTCQADWDRRASYMERLNGENVVYVSFEPLIEAINVGGRPARADWFIIGGMTGPRAKPCPASYVDTMVRQARDMGVPVYVKDSHYDLFPIREFPVSSCRDLQTLF